MNHKNNILTLGIAAALIFSGCSSSGPVPVQQVSQLSKTGIVEINDKFPGVVVSEKAVEIKKETDKTVKDLYVEVGDKVAADEKLFSYDTEELSLTLDKQELDMDKLDAGISDKEDQIASVNKELDEASGNLEAQLKIQLRQLETELTQANYDKAAKQKEIDYTKKMLEDVDVRSPVKGTVRKIDDSGDGPFIVIQESGAYKVKGTLNELSLSAGIMEGTVVRVVSRIDPEKTWSGAVSEVDYNSGAAGLDNGGYGEIGMVGGMEMDNSMANSTNYPFYITLLSTDGLLLGQHVYIEVSADGTVALNDTLAVPRDFVMEYGLNEATQMNEGFVWKANDQDVLEKTAVTLGEYDKALGGYPVIEGLTGEDYIADPSNPFCKEGAEVSYRNPSDFGEDPEETAAQTVEASESTPETVAEVTAEQTDASEEGTQAAETTEDKFAQMFPEKEETKATEGTEDKFAQMFPDSDEKEQED